MTTVLHNDVDRTAPVRLAPGRLSWPHRELGSRRAEQESGANQEISRSPTSTYYVELTCKILEI